MPAPERLIWTIALAGTAFIVPLHAHAGFAELDTLKSSALLLAGTLAAARALGTREPMSRAEAWMIAFLGIAAVHAIASGPSVRWACEPVVGAAAALAIAAATRRAVLRVPALRTAAIDLAIGVAAVIAVVAIAEGLGLRLPWSATRRPQSLLGNRNFVGAYAAIVLPLIAWRLHVRPYPLLVAALHVSVIALILSRCRSAWLAALVCGAVGAWLAMRARRAPSRWFVGALAVSVALAVGLPWPGLRWTDDRPLASTLGRLGEYERGSGRGRIDQARVGAAIVRDAPWFGVGPHGWADAAAAHTVERTMANTVPSSDLVRIASETGVVGLLLVLAATVELARGAWPDRRQPAVVAIGLALAAAAIHATFDAPLYRAESLALIGVLVGLVPQRTVGRAPRWLSSGAGLALIAACGAGAALVTASIVSTVVEHRGGADALAAAQRWAPRPERQQKLVDALGRAGRCEEQRAALAVAIDMAPHFWGPGDAAARCWQARASQLFGESR